MSKERRRIIRAYCDDTGRAEIDMREVARWAIRHGWRLPTPKSPIDLLAREFAAAAREERQLDPKSGRYYRVYHSIEARRSAAFVPVDRYSSSISELDRALVDSPP